MKRLRAVSVSLMAAMATVCALPAAATGICANGKAIYNKKVAAVEISCSQNSCHKSDLSGNTMASGVYNPGKIDDALNSVNEMQGLRATLGLTASDIDDVATYIFYYPSACPAGRAPNLGAAPATVSFATTAVGATRGATTVTISNTGTASATSVTAASGDPAHFPVSANTCAGVTLGTAAGSNACSFKVAFQPTAAGPAGTSINISWSGGTLQVGVSGTGATVEGPAPTITVVEYHNSAFDHYFITPVAAEISLLDAHAPPFQDWSRTGFTFNSHANATAPAGSVAICRFFNSTFAPKSSHFYAPHGLGCEVTIAGFPDWGLEDDSLFNSMLPDASGACPQGTVPVYRLYNNGMGAAPNHRFVTSLTERQKMINQGFVAEGAGIGIGMCVPP